MVGEESALFFVRILLRIGAALLVVVVARYLARAVRAFISRTLSRTDLPESIVVLTENITFYLVWFGAISMALAVLGVPVASLVTIGGATLIVLAIALQQSLGNLAATVVFSLFRPFDEGHLIETLGVLGWVKEIQLFSTVVISPDNKVHVLPNGRIQNEGLSNLSKLGWVRRDLSFQVSYGDDVPKALTVIRDVLSADTRVRDEPPPDVFVQELGDNGIVLAAWPFVQPHDYWEIQFDLVEQVKAAFDGAGLTVPFPQRDLHVRNVSVSLLEEEETT